MLLTKCFMYVYAEEHNCYCQCEKPISLLLFFYNPNPELVKLHEHPIIK